MLKSGPGRQRVDDAMVARANFHGPSPLWARPWLRSALPQTAKAMRPLGKRAFAQMFRIDFEYARFLGLPHLLD
jgi:hypothetical protein